MRHFKADPVKNMEKLSLNSLFFIEEYYLFNSSFIPFQITSYLSIFLKRYSYHFQTTL